MAERSPSGASFVGLDRQPPDSHAIVAARFSTGQLVRSAIAAERSGNFRAAVAFDEEVLSREPNNIESLMALGRLYDKLGNFEKALEMQRRLLELQPRDRDTLHRAAMLSVKLGRPLDKLGAKDEMAISFLTTQEIIFCATTLRERASYSHEAVIICQREIVRREPQNEKALTYLAIECVKAGRLAEAIEARETLQRLKPDDRQNVRILLELRTRLKRG